jgi:hypothetical protein
MYMHCGSESANSFYCALIFGSESANSFYCVLIFPSSLSFCFSYFDFIIFYYFVVKFVLWHLLWYLRYHTFIVVCYLFYGG